MQLGSSTGYVGLRLSGSGSAGIWDLYSSYGSGIKYFGVYDRANSTYRLVANENGHVGIGTDSPSTFDARANNLVVRDTGDGGITIVSGDSSDCRIAFTIAADTGLSNGQIHYDNNDDSMHFATGGSDRVVINGNRVHVGTGEQYGATGKRGIRVGRTMYNWFNYGKNEGHTYIHIKTDLQFPTGSNPQPTMSMLHIKGYTYSSESIDSILGFHNWSGTIHNPVYTNNGTRTVVSSSWAPYRSSDNYVVIVLSIGNNYPGISIDWHQAFDPYTWRDISVLAFTKNANTSGVY